MIAFTLQKRIKQNTTTSLPEVNPSLQSKAPAIMSLTDIPKPDDQSLTVRLHPNPVTPPPQSPMRVSVQRESVPSIIPIAQPKKKTNERQIKTPTKKPTFSKIVSKTTFERDGKKIQQTIKLDKNGHEIIIEKEIEKKVITRKFDAKTKKQVGTTTTKTTRKKQSRTAVVKHLPKVSAKIDDSYTTTPDMLEGEDIPFTSETDNLHILPPETKLESPHTPDKTPKDVSIPDINYEEDEE
ncbi:hypothetical protein FACS1894166_08040 [Bacilli bacterium]|nr:hypothetical protein FACS1894166_08040 [Bacilli bacterium]